MSAPAKMTHEGIVPVTHRLARARSTGQEVMVALVRSTTALDELLKWYLSPDDLLIPLGKGQALMVLEASRAQALQLGEGILQNLYDAEYQGVFLLAWGSTKDHGYGTAEILSALHDLHSDWTIQGETLAVALATPEVSMDAALEAGVQ